MFKGVLQHNGCEEERLIYMHVLAIECGIYNANIHEDTDVHITSPRRVFTSQSIAAI